MPDIVDRPRQEHTSRYYWEREHEPDEKFIPYFWQEFTSQVMIFFLFLGITLVALGLYGKVLPNQDGAPLRLVVPWKYGFKGIKSIVKIMLVEEQPPTTWSAAAPNEYGFYATVNPSVDHPRWSQAKERRLGEFLKRPTLMFNGYDQVASLYSGMDLKKNF